jgi:hypothetical protein
MDSLDKLLALEAIRNLKARYFRTMDGKDWSGLASCFTEDLFADFRDAPGMLAKGRDNYMRSLQEALGDSPTVHHGHTPEIEIIDEENARGVWAMDDLIELPGLSLRGWGHYHEEYRCEDGEWKISRTKLTRLKLLINGEKQAV